MNTMSHPCFIDVIRTTSLSKRRTRLRTTALPTSLATEKPHRLNSNSLGNAFMTTRLSTQALPDLKALPNELEFSRCGFSVAKDVGKAVVRNRVRRLLREVVRITSIKHGWEIVFIARPGRSEERRV